MLMWKRILGLLVLASGWLPARPFSVLVYNVENLHDVDGVAVYDDYQPSAYSRDDALTKLRNIASVVAKCGEGRGPEIILFQEIEIDHTPGKGAPDYAAILKGYAGTTIEHMLGDGFTTRVADLPAEALLLKTFADRGLDGYTVVPGGDRSVSAMDVAERPAMQTVVFTRFPVKGVRTYPLPRARNLLEVTLEVDGRPLTVFNNHWKSGAGDAKIEPIRIENARVLRLRLDELLKADPNADIIIGGDLNSHYNQKRRYRAMKETGINDVLGSQGNELAVRGPSRDLYNLWFELPEAERGSDTYKGEWGTLMHLIVSRGLYDLAGVRYIDNSFGVAKFSGLNADAAGLPVRWSAQGHGGRGFSDHFPVYARFETVETNQPGKFAPLVRDSGREDSGDGKVNKVDLSKTDFSSAVVLARLPAGANLRDGTWTGKLFRVEAAALDGRLLKIEVSGETYDVFGPRKEIRDRLYAQRRAGGRLAFYGELGIYKGNWQFLVKSEEWVK